MTTCINFDDGVHCSKSSSMAKTGAVLLLARSFAGSFSRPAATVRATTSQAEEASSATSASILASEIPANYLYTDFFQDSHPLTPGNLTYSSP